MGDEPVGDTVGETPTIREARAALKDAGVCARGVRAAVPREAPLSLEKVPMRRLSESVPAV
jgi:hypothetical protein